MKSIRNHFTIITIVILTALVLTSCKSALPADDVLTTPELPATEVSVRPTNTARPPQPQTTAVPTLIPNSPTPLPSPTPEPTPTPTEEIAATPVEAPTVEISPMPTATKQAPVAPSLPKVPQVIATNALAIVPNVDPGPPFSVEISANQLLEGYLHRVSGIIRNDSEETYNGLNVIGTFFMENGKRYGPIDVNVKCLMLAPGATCPFVIEATSKNLIEVIIHVTGDPTPRTPLSPEYYGVRYAIDTIGYVHVTGTVRNPYTIPARHVTVVGSLVNAQGEIVNVNATILLKAIPAGGSAPFNIDLKYTPFSTVSITTQAEP